MARTSRDFGAGSKGLYLDGMEMIYREAQETDIPGIMEVRVSVRENQLSEPGKIPASMVREYLFQRGKGFVCEIGGTIGGFSIVSLPDANVWALFIRPEHEGKGMGKKLHDLMVDWYFSQQKTTLWLTTDLGTRAEQFYTRQGWKRIRVNEKGEILFQMEKIDWET